MTKIYEFPIKLPNLNDYTKANRGNKFLANQIKQNLESELIWYMKSQGVVRFNKKVKITFDWFEKNKRRDMDNVAFAKKFILDAMQKAEVLEGDGWKNIKGFSDNFFISKEENFNVYYKYDYGVIVTLKEVE